MPNAFVAVQGVLVEMYAEVYADILANESIYFNLERFTKQLVRTSWQRGWSAVVGYDTEKPIGYAYGYPLEPNAVWWNATQPPPDAKFRRETGGRTVAMFELMVREPFRRRGIAETLHQEFVAGYPGVERATLLVRQDNPSARRLYERWGYRRIGDCRPEEHAPLYATMVLDLRGGAPGQGRP